MSNFLVFEKVPDTQTGYGAVALVAPDFSNQLITCVEAESAEEAVQLVMAATRRVGIYAVVKCDTVSFLPGEVTTQKDGILRAKKDEKKELTNGDN